MKNLTDLPSIQAAFEEAISRHNAFAVRHLIRKGADVNKADAQGFPPLARAVSWGPKDFSWDTSKTPSHYEIQHKTKNVLNALLRAGADVEWKDTEEGYGYSVRQLGFFSGFMKAGDVLDKILVKAEKKAQAAKPPKAG